MPEKRDSIQGSNLTCSFCGKSQKEVKKLIAGPTVYICDECIGLCNDIIAEEIEKEEQSYGTEAIPKPAAIKKIQELGGSVNFKRGGYEVILSGADIKNEDLACLKDIASLKSVDLRGTPINDEGLQYVKGLTGLDFINVQRTPVTFEGAEALRKALPNTDVRR